MTDLQPLLQNITTLTPFAVALVVVAGLVVGVAPSSFPLISVAAGLSAVQDAGRTGGRWAGIWRSVGFALGTSVFIAGYTIAAYWCNIWLSPMRCWRSCSLSPAWLYLE